MCWSDRVLLDLQHGKCVLNLHVDLLWCCGVTQSLAADRQRLCTSNSACFLVDVVQACLLVGSVDLLGSCDCCRLTGWCILVCSDLVEHMVTC